MIVIRLTRVGKKNSPAYRVVVADKRRAVKRKFIEILGNYNPTRNPKQFVIDKERALFWIERGAQPSPTIRNLMVDAGVLPKTDKIKIVYGKEKSKKAPTGTLRVVKEDAGKKPEAITEEPEVTSEQTETSESAETPEQTEETKEEPVEVESETKEEPVSAESLAEVETKNK